MSFSERWRVERRRRLIVRLASAGLVCAAAFYAGRLVWRQYGRRGLNELERIAAAALKPPPRPPEAPRGLLMPPEPERPREIARAEDSTAFLEPLPRVPSSEEAQRKAKPKPRLAPVRDILSGGFRRLQARAPEPKTEEEEAPVRIAPVMGEGPSDEQVRKMQRSHRDPIAMERLQERVREFNAREDRKSAFKRGAAVAGGVVLGCFLATLILSGLWRALVWIFVWDRLPPRK